MTPGQHVSPPLVTLSIDCGGTGLKALLLDADASPLADRVRIPTPYPLSPDRFVATLVDLTTGLTGYDRVTVGLPGMIRHGRVVHTPHYPRIAGPFTPVDAVLDEQWRGFDAQAALTEAFGRPTRVFNDAEVQGAALISGTGLELVLTLGTGLGCAIFDDGALAPHLELSHHPFRHGQTYDQQLGNQARKSGSHERWVRRVRKAISALQPVVWYDHLHVGGGNAKYLPADLGPTVSIGPNTAGLTGGVRAWDLRTNDERTTRQGTT
jgi:polyphosphate glucokinase